MVNKKNNSDFIAHGIIAQNRRANFDYLIEKTYTAGLALTGTEVKSLRLGHATGAGVGAGSQGRFRPRDVVLFPQHGGAGRRAAVGPPSFGGRFQVLVVGER